MNLKGCHWQCAGWFGVGRGSLTRRRGARKESDCGLLGPFLRWLPVTVFLRLPWQCLPGTGSPSQAFKLLGPEHWQWASLRGALAVT